MGSPLQNTFNVWHALFLREIFERVFTVRMGAFWLFVEPALHITALSIIWTLIRQKDMGGMDVIAWIMTGMLTFFLFRRTSGQVMNAIKANSPYFAFRQIRPFDAAFMRGCAEAFISIITSIFLLCGAAFIGRDLFPHDILRILIAIFGMWMLGMGYGMVTSVILQLVPESRHILKIIMMPLYLLSGIIMPLSIVPAQYRKYLLYNPIVHGVESVRLSFFSNYNTITPDIGYLYMWALCSFVLGITLYRVYETQLVSL